MKLFTIIVVLIYSSTFFSCNQVEKTKTSSKYFDCNLLSNRKFILEIAKSIIKNGDNTNIVNLTSDFDTNNIFFAEDYFVNNKTKNKLVVIQGEAGMSAGSENNLLILFSCKDSLEVLWSGQDSFIEKENIIDLNGDGVKEIIKESSQMWMGYCSKNYSIINFKNGNINYLLNKNSSIYTDCENEDFNSLFQKGDTLDLIYNFNLEKNNQNKYIIKQISTFKIHNGGINDDEIISKLKIINDTTLIYIK